MSWWVTRTEHTLSDDIPAPPDQVRDFYVDLNNIQVVHPLVVSVQSISRDENAAGYRQSYRVRDRIPVGPFALRISYRASVEVPSYGDVITEARQFPRVRLSGAVVFEPIEPGTRLTERLRISAPRLIASVTQREAVNAHKAMLAGIRNHFENR